MPSDEEILGDWICRSSSFKGLLDLIASTGARAFVVGGAVRTRLLHDRPNPRDLDVVVENTSEEVLRYLSRSMPVMLRTEEAGTVLLPDGTTADVFSPGSFREGCGSAEEMLRWFDLSVNAVGIPLDPSEVRLDPVGGVADASARRLMLIERRWVDADDRDAIHLTMRLLELARRVAGLTVGATSVLERCLPLVENVRDWSPVRECHGLSQPEAVTMLRGLLATQPGLIADNRV